MIDMMDGRCFLFPPKFVYLKNGCGFRAYCPLCGKMVQYSTGCNLAGISYAELAAREKVVRHLPTCTEVILTRSRFEQSQKEKQ